MLYGLNVSGVLQMLLLLIIVFCLFVIVVVSIWIVGGCLLNMLFVLVDSVSLFVSLQLSLILVILVVLIFCGQNLVLFGLQFIEFLLQIVLCSVVENLLSVQKVEVMIFILGDVVLMLLIVLMLNIVWLMVMFWLLIRGGVVFSLVILVLL